METHGTALRHVGLALVIVVLVLSVLGGGLLRPAQSPSPASPAHDALPAVPPEIAASSGLALAERSLGYDPQGPSPVLSPFPLGSAPAVTWHNVSTVSPTAPVGRYLAAFAWDTVDHEALLFGGCTRSGSLILGDTWTYVNGTWTNLTSSLPQAPPARCGAEVAFDPTSQRLILAGGINTTGKILSDTWAFSHGAWTNITTQVSGALPVHGIAVGAAATDWAHSRLVLFGGESGPVNTVYPFLYAFQGNAWTNLSTLAGPRGRIVPGLAYDPTHGDMVMSGGSQDNHYVLPDTWTLNGSQWTNVSTFPPGLETTVFATLSWIPALHGLLLIGGAMFTSSSFAGYVPTPAWLYQSGTWTNVSGTVASPGVPVSYAGVIVSQFAEDPSTGALIMAGGFQTGGFTTWETDATWVLSAPLHLSATRSGGPVGATVDVGIPVSYDVQVNGGVSAVATSLSWGDLSVTTQAGAGNYTATHSYATPGPMLVTLSGTDLVGDTPSTAWLVNVVADPSVTSLGPSWASTDVGRPLSFSPAVSGGTAPLSYAWSFGDGTNGTGAAPAHNYTHPGTYLVKLTVKDGDSLTATGAVSVNVSADPVVAASVNPASLVNGETVNFTAAVTGGTGTLTYVWSFGDGGSGTGATPTHSYAAPGNYTVRVTVTDARGATASGTLHVDVQSQGGSSSAASLSPLSWPPLALLLVIAFAALAGIFGALWARGRKGRAKAAPPPSAPPPVWSEPPPTAPPYPPGPHP